MLTLLSELFSWLACRLRRRAALELEIIALRHQLAVLRRQHPGRVRLFSIDRFLWGLALPGATTLPGLDGAGEAGDRS
jgi:putative transposase